MLSHVKPFIFLLSLTLSSSHAQGEQPDPAADINHMPITLWSEGVRLAGDIYKPSTLQADKTLPGILLVPGWGGSKANLGKNYAPQFAEAGFIVLTFDFKGWGESDGPLLASEKLDRIEETQTDSFEASHVRKVVNPRSMSADVRAALHYLGAEPGVTPSNLGIWGTSMGGALALAASAEDHRVKALVNQMGPVNTQYNLRNLPDAALQHAEAQAARGEAPPYPGPNSKLSPQLQGFPDWVAMKRFTPLAQLENLQAATLIIDAEKESLFEIKKNGQLVYQDIKERLPSRYLVLPGGHYDLYKGDSLSTARSSALEWFVTHLKP